jgi:hypothetical protein
MKTRLEYFWEYSKDVMVIFGLEVILLFILQAENVDIALLLALAIVAPTAWELAKNFYHWVEGQSYE